jgi:uncharacterized protein
VRRQQCSQRSLQYVVSKGRSREFPIGGEPRTVEDVVRELLQPMMRDWLAEKLAPIIERLVRAELARALGEMGES